MNVGTFKIKKKKFIKKRKKKTFLKICFLNEEFPVLKRFKYK